MKIFCIGAHKTATTSLRNATAKLGFKTEPGTSWYNGNLRREYYRGNYAPIYAQIQKFDSLKDSPFNHKDFYKVLFAEYPNAKYILTVRDTESWFSSLYRWHINYVLPRGMLPDYNMYWIKWYNVPLTAANFKRDIHKHKDAIIQEYQRRNEEVKEFFQAQGASDRLLVIDIAQETNPWLKLAPFLGKQPPQIPFPVANRQPTAKKPKGNTFSVK